MRLITAEIQNALRAAVDLFNDLDALPEEAVMEVPVRKLAALEIALRAGDCFPAIEKPPAPPPWDHGARPPMGLPG
jgi:hypothetical protein